MKNYLFVLNKPAYCGNHVQETLDIILTTAAFDQAVSLLLLDDGVFQLKKNQNPPASLKDTAAIFSALEIYDVTRIYVEAESMLDRGLKPEDLCLPVELVNRKAITKLMAGFDIVFAD